MFSYKIEKFILNLSRPLEGSPSQSSISESYKVEKNGFLPNILTLISRFVCNSSEQVKHIDMEFQFNKEDDLFYFLVIIDVYGIEEHLSQRDKELICLEDKIIVHDLINTYFEGEKRNSRLPK